MKGTIYIGEVLHEVLPPNSTIKIGNSTDTLFTHTPQIGSRVITQSYITIMVN